MVLDIFTTLKLLFHLEFEKIELKNCQSSDIKPSLSWLKQSGERKKV